MQNADGISQLAIGTEHCFISSLYSWHRRHDHRNLADIKRASSRLNNNITRCACSDHCDASIRGKQPNKPFPKQSEKPDRPLDFVISDLSGPWPQSHERQSECLGRQRMGQRQGSSTMQG